MEYSKPLGGLAVLALLVWLGGAIASLGFANDLLLSSDWQIAAAVSLLVFVASVLAFISLGTAWRRWQRTPYW